MKQLLFLLLFPSLALAQYTGNAGQKITLGEQTTADGLVYRGLAADTTRKPSVDTMAYILLDTNTNIIWQYKKAINNAWTRLNLTQSDTTSFNYVNTYGTQTVNGAKTFTSAVTATRFNPNSSTATGKGMFAPTGGSIGFSTNNLERIRINSSGLVGIGTTNDIGILSVKQVGAELTLQTDNTNVYFEGINRDNLDGSVNYGFYARNGSHKFWTGAYTERLRITNDGEAWVGYTTDNGAYPLQVNGQIFATNATIATSDEKFKENITPLNKGLEIVNKLKPVTFNFIPDTKNNFSEYEEVGFIAQDVDRALSTESFSKSIVKSADDSEPTSTMGLATQNLIPILVKAIQEQQALIKALEQRILILENK